MKVVGIYFVRCFNDWRWEELTLLCLGTSLCTTEFPLQFSLKPNKTLFVRNYQLNSTINKTFFYIKMNYIIIFVISKFFFLLKSIISRYLRLWFFIFQKICKIQLLMLQNLNDIFVFCSHITIFYLIIFC